MRGAWVGWAMLVATVCGMAAAGEVADERPNLVLVMADDLGLDWIGCYGGEGKTPAIDRLAAEGMRFRHVWSQPICTPTRLTLLTGQYPFRTGWIDHHDVPRWGGVGFDPGRFVCWAQVLREAGYATAIGGKWQVNDLRVDGEVLAKHGFDEHCVWPGYETGNAPPSDERYWGAYLVTNGERTVHDGKFGPDVVNAFLVDFIRRHREEPFAVYYPMLLPHGPVVATPENPDDAPEKKRELYAGMVAYVDTLVGRLVEAIDAMGLGERTVVMFTCDNGSPMGGLRNERMYGPGKGRVVDRGAAVPLVVRAPQVIRERAGHVSEALVDFSDFYPTLVELAGGEQMLPAIRQEQPLDGTSFVDVLQGTRSAGEGRQWMFAQRGSARMVRDRRLVVTSEGKLYDLEDETAGQEATLYSVDPAVHAAVDRLEAVLGALPADAAAPFAEFGRKK